MIKQWVVLGLALGLAACGNISAFEKPGTAEWAPAEPIKPQAAQATAGAIFQVGHNLNLTTDHRARQVGDNLTVTLAERTEATKQASTDTAKNTQATISAPTVFNQPLDFMNGSLSASTEFSGSGGSSQSNRLSGSITVTVFEVLANGNLRVRGEKWLTLNQGEEFIRISGTVRPIDLAPDNSVPSFKLADARITYSGKGVLDEANRMGWLARFFQSILSPL